VGTSKRTEPNLCKSNTNFRTFLVQDWSHFLGTICMTTKFQLTHKIMGSSSLMSCGCENLVHLQPSVVHLQPSVILPIKFMYGFCDDLEDSNVQTIHSLIVGNDISVDKKEMLCHFKVSRKKCGQFTAYYTGTDCLVPAD